MRHVPCEMACGPSPGQGPQAIFETCPERNRQKRPNVDPWTPLPVINIYPVGSTGGFRGLVSQLGLSSPSFPSPFSLGGALSMSTLRLGALPWAVFVTPLTRIWNDPVPWIDSVISGSDCENVTGHFDSASDLPRRLCLWMRS